jgi:hypothetical protein
VTQRPATTMRSRDQGLCQRLMVGLVAVGALAAQTGCGADDRPPVWEYISPAIIQPNCATSSCHSPGAAVAGLDFSTPERGYTSLTGLWTWILDPNGTPEANCRKVGDYIACQRGFRPMVIPYDPGQSRLVHMLRARGVNRMPPDRPLPEADIRLIERWILEGAQKAGRGPPGPPTVIGPPRDAGTDTNLDMGSPG